MKAAKNIWQGIKSYYLCSPQAKNGGRFLRKGGAVTEADDKKSLKKRFGGLEKGITFAPRNRVAAGCSFKRLMRSKK